MCRQSSHSFEEVRLRSLSFSESDQETASTLQSVAEGAASESSSIRGIRVMSLSSTIVSEEGSSLLSADAVVNPLDIKTTPRIASITYVETQEGLQ